MQLFVQTLIVASVLMFFSATVSAGTSQEVTPTVQEIRIVKPFTTLFVDAPIHVAIIVGQPQSLTVSATEDILNDVIVHVSHGELRLSTRKQITPATRVSVHITVPTLTGVYAHSASIVSIRNLTYNLFSLYTGGSGDIILDGIVDSIEIESDGAGTVDASRLFARSADVISRSSGNIKVWAQRVLHAWVYADGDIECFGDPDDVVEDREGTGDITKK